MTVIELANTGRDLAQYSMGEVNYSPNVYRCHVAILREEDGGFSVVCLNLPGAGSCGDTENEAIENAREAIAGVIESYVEDGLEIPWSDLSQYTVPEGAKQKWILVHA